MAKKAKNTNTDENGTSVGVKGTKVARERKTYDYHAIASKGKDETSLGTFDTVKDLRTAINMLREHAPEVIDGFDDVVCRITERDRSQQKRSIDGQSLIS